MTLTINRAIELLEHPLFQEKLKPYPDTSEAVKLGVEALKRLQDIRHTIYSDLQSPLPGETE